MTLTVAQQSAYHLTIGAIMLKHIGPKTFERIENWQGNLVAYPKE